MQPTSHAAVILIAVASRELSARLDAALALLDAGADRQTVQAVIDQARRDLNQRLAHVQRCVNTVQ